MCFYVGTPSGSRAHTHHHGVDGNSLRPLVGELLFTGLTSFLQVRKKLSTQDFNHPWNVPHSISGNTSTLNKNPNCAGVDDLAASSGHIPFVRCPGEN